MRTLGQAEYLHGRRLQADAYDRETKAKCYNALVGWSIEKWLPFKVASPVHS